MPPLAPNQILRLKQFIADNPVQHSLLGVQDVSEHFEAEDLVCWKWALFGLQDNVTFQGVNTPTLIQRPGELFTTYVNGINHVLDPRSWWLEPGIAGQLIDFASEHDTWRDNVMHFACQLVCSRAGMVPVVQSAYTLVMHYEASTLNPNETHYWIEVDLGDDEFVCIETFPVGTDPEHPNVPPTPTIQYRFNTRYSDETNVRIPIQGLLQQHLDVINDAVLEAHDVE
ncbi:hypothetical protein LX64_03113 [Chitinophaga skermanii]|uniref:Uncharacterized protein n=1 Tax=Chitinophaga skermanii TaxID=331697 RepID=A0A327QLL5_9BACT|nr:hypothetical protein [Chitinophaga skermanii]RAJ04233.1 hypothetical protein LX64_03113 [Chitinophaga skermanii]